MAQILRYVQAEIPVRIVLRFPLIPSSIWTPIELGRPLASLRPLTKLSQLELIPISFKRYIHALKLVLSTKLII